MEMPRNRRRILGGSGPKGRRREAFLKERSRPLLADPTVKKARLPPGRILTLTGSVLKTGLLPTEHAGDDKGRWVLSPEGRASEAVPFSFHSHRP